MRIAVAADGSRAAICELARIVIVEIPSGVRIGELVFDAEAHAPAYAREVAWLGERLFVLSRHPARTHVAYVDITRSGPHTLAELQIDEPIELRAATERCALVSGAAAAYILAPHGDDLGAAPFATAALPSAACGTSTAIVVALPSGAVEVWDPAVGRARAMFAGASDVRCLGANDRGCVWTVTASAPAILDARTRQFALPEPIRAIACEPASDVVLCLGERAAYVCDLARDGVAALQVPGRPIAIALARGQRAIVAQEGGAVTVIGLAAHAHDDWRGRLVRWAAAERGGALPSLPPIEAVLRKRAVDRALAPAVALLYAAHVVGERGCAPVDIAQVVGRWTEALGTGTLAATGIAVYAASRVVLADALARELDASL